MTVKVEPSHLMAPRSRLLSRTAPRIFTVPANGFVRSWTHWSKPVPMAGVVCPPQLVGGVEGLFVVLPPPGVRLAPPPRGPVVPEPSPADADGRVSAAA